MDRIYNFAAGPAMLPKEVLAKVKEEFLSYRGTGTSIAEMPISSPYISELIESAEDLLRKLLNVPINYRVLFLSGGVAEQFSAIPQNLLSEHRCADYIVTGQHSKHAAIEAKKYGDITIAASSAGALPAFSTIPLVGRSDFRPDADYVHICFNNAVYGTKYFYIPDTGSIPLVADMSSCLLTEPVEVAKFGLIYASVEHNIAPAGMTIVIVRDDLVGGARRDTPAGQNYRLLSESITKYDTPPIFQLYIAKLVFEWIQSLGGLSEMKRRNERKASLLYDYLDSQEYYTAPVNRSCRSMTNITFITGDASLDKAFVAEAAKEGLVNLEGDETIGGLRASNYNALTYDGIEKLIAFMKRFAENHPKFML